MARLAVTLSRRSSGLKRKQEQSADGSEAAAASAAAVAQARKRHKPDTSVTERSCAPVHTPQPKSAHIPSIGPLPAAQQALLATKTAVHEVTVADAVQPWLPASHSAAADSPEKLDSPHCGFSIEAKQTLQASDSDCKAPSLVHAIVACSQHSGLMQHEQAPCKAEPAIMSTHSIQQPQAEADGQPDNQLVPPPGDAAVLVQTAPAAAASEKDEHLRALALQRLQGFQAPKPVTPDASAGAHSACAADTPVQTEDPVADMHGYQTALSAGAGQHHTPAADRKPQPAAAPFIFRAQRAEHSIAQPAAPGSGAPSEQVQQPALPPLDMPSSRPGSGQSDSTHAALSPAGENLSAAMQPAPSPPDAHHLQDCSHAPPSPHMDLTSTRPPISVSHAATHAAGDSSHAAAASASPSRSDRSTRFDQLHQAMCRSPASGWPGSAPGKPDRSVPSSPTQPGRAHRSLSITPADSQAGRAARAAPSSTVTSSIGRKSNSIPESKPAPPAMAAPSPYWRHKSLAKLEAASGPQLILPIQPPQAILANVAAFDLVLMDIKDSQHLWSVVVRYGSCMIPRHRATVLLTLAHLSPTSSLGDLTAMQPSLLLDVGRDARQYTGRMAADTLWAVAQLQQHSPQLAHKLVMQLRDFMSHLDPADLALAIWALASMQHSSLLLPIPELLKQVKIQIGAYTAEQAHDTIMGLAALQADLPADFSRMLACQLLGAARKCLTSSLLSAVLTACSTGTWDASILLQLAPRIDVAQLELGTVVILLKTYADNAFSPGLKLLDAVVREAVQCQNDGAWAKVQTEMLCSFARLDYWPGEELLSKCFDTLFQMLPKARKLLLPSSDVADCLWALAVLDAPPGGEEHLAKHINEDSLTADQLCKLLWALALFDNGSWKRWQRFISALASRPLQDCTELALQNLHAAHEIWHATTCKLVGSKQLSWPAKVLHEAEQAWLRHEDSEMNADAVATTEVEATLQEMKICHTRDVCAVRHMHINFHLTDYSAVAILVHGSAAFAYNSVQVPLGHTITRRLILKQQGWTVLSIPCHEWRRVSHSWQLRKQYIRQLIRLHACRRTAMST